MPPLRLFRERLFLFLLHFCVPEDPAPLAFGPFVHPSWITGAPEHRRNGLVLFNRPR
jgi:hypothetical protein